MDAIAAARVPASWAAEACGCDEAELISALEAAGRIAIVAGESPGTCAKRLTPAAIRMLADLGLPITVAAQIAGVALRTLRVRAEGLGVSFVRGMACERVRKARTPSEAAAPAGQMASSPDSGAIEVLARDLCQHVGRDPDERAPGGLRR